MTRPLDPVRTRSGRGLEPAHRRPPGLAVGGTPGLVTVHLWQVPRRHVPAAVARMGLDRSVRRRPGVRFAKLLGTGDGSTFRLRDADLTRWGLLVAWDRAQDAAGFSGSRTARGWDAIAVESLRLDLRPLSARGRWSGRAPFGDPQVRDWDGPVVALTRARVRAGRSLAFARAAPGVARELHGSAGLRLAVGVGDAPFGLLGTLSIWDSAAALTAFAYRGPAHLDAMRRSREQDWFAEDLFARFALLSSEGTLDGRTP